MQVPLVHYVNTVCVRVYRLVALAKHFASMHNEYRMLQILLIIQLNNISGTYHHIILFIKAIVASLKNAGYRLYIQCSSPLFLHVRTISPHLTSVPHTTLTLTSIAQLIHPAKGGHY